MRIVKIAVRMDWALHMRSREKPPCNDHFSDKWGLTLKAEAGYYASFRFLHSMTYKVTGKGPFIITIQQDTSHWRAPEIMQSLAQGPDRWLLQMMVIELVSKILSLYFWCTKDHESIKEWPRCLKSLLRFLCLCVGYMRILHALWPLVFINCAHFVTV